MKKKNNSGKIFLIILLVIIIGGVGYLYYINKFNTDEKDEYSDYTPQEEISDEQYRETIVELYFRDKETGNIIAEAKAIDAKKLLQNPYKELVNLLIKGTENEKLQNLIPEGTTVYDAYLEAGVVVLNVSSDILNFNNDETLKNNIINSITKTLCELNEVNSVRFLIDGQENEELSEIYTCI
ncbi:MAG: GerMN domain-containing protein [Clostridia bacterium]|nr:GerMN domain-containing protein [Clostridia bacterium]